MSRSSHLFASLMLQTYMPGQGTLTGRELSTVELLVKMASLFKIKIYFQCFKQLI